MVDHRTFLAWLVQQCSTSNLAQLGFVVRLADEYLDGMLVCHALVRPLVEACTLRLAEVIKCAVYYILEFPFMNTSDTRCNCQGPARRGRSCPQIYTSGALTYADS